MKTPPQTTTVHHPFSGLFMGLKKMPKRTADYLSKWDSRLNPKQRIILFVLLLATWCSIIIMETTGHFQSRELSIKTVSGEPAVWMDSTLNQTKTKDHENIQH